MKTSDEFWSRFDKLPKELKDQINYASSVDSCYERIGFVWSVTDDDGKPAASFDVQGNTTEFKSPALEERERLRQFLDS